MNRRNFLIPIFLAALATAASVSAQSEPFAPDMAQFAIDSLSIECQNVNDYLTALNAGVETDFESAYRSFQTAAVNLESMLGAAGRNYAARLNAALPYFTADADGLTYVLSECFSVRHELQTALRDQTQAAAGQPVYSFDECVANGFFTNDGVCFLNGNIAYDTDGYMIGRYNTDCFDAYNYYPGSCWYCIYGNTDEGCIYRPQ